MSTYEELVFEGWYAKEVPHPDDFDTPIGHLNNAIGDLTVTEDGKYFAAGDIRRLILAELGRIDGAKSGGWRRR